MCRLNTTSIRALSYISALCTLFCLEVAGTCYYPDGRADTSGWFEPCNKNGQSMCCATNRDAGNADICTDNGFCIPHDNNGIWRGLCTDQSWDDPACIKLCHNGINVDNSSQKAADNVVPITTCGDKSLCCGSILRQVGMDCCESRRGVYVDNGKLVSTSPASSRPTATSASSSASTNGTSPQSTPSPEPSSSNTGAIVGGVVAGVAGVVILAFAFWFFMIRRSLKQRSQLPSQSYEPYQTDKPPVMWQGVNEAPTYESKGRRGELDSLPIGRTQELDVR